MYTLNLTKEEVSFLQKGAMLLDIEASKRKSYTSEDREFNRQLIVKLISVEPCESKE